MLSFFTSADDGVGGVGAFLSDIGEQLPDSLKAVCSRKGEVKKERLSEEGLSELMTSNSNRPLMSKDGLHSLARFESDCEYAVSENDGEGEICGEVRQEL